MSVQNFDAKKFVPKGYAAVCYEKEGNTKFRDRITVFFDGKVLFERFCWGEAAGLVFAVWAEEIRENGEILWKKPFDAAVKEDALPKQVSNSENNAFYFDENAAKWALEDTKKTDPNHGYTGLKMLFGKFKN